MASNKLFTLPDSVTKENLEEVMQQAITLELATIPTYLSTYYSINRAQDQDVLHAKLKAQLSLSGERSACEIDYLAQELKLDVLVYANKSAALVMSVVIEEMLHLALSCNVKQAVCEVAPDILGIGKVLSFPAELDGHDPEFQIDAAKLSLKQLKTFLMIESPKPFENPQQEAQMLSTVEYKTIGGLYKKIEACIKKDFAGTYKPQRPQLLPPDSKSGPRPFYSQNSSNTIHYDRNHKPHFANQDDSGGLVGVYNSEKAIEALHKIIEQGEGSSTKQDEKPQHLIEWDENGMPLPMEVVDDEDGGKKVVFWEGDYEDGGKEPAHFAKFLEAYSLGEYYEGKFNSIEGLDDFFSYFVYNQKSNPTQADYEASGNEALALCNKLGSALFTYILLMIETCYYKDESTQYDLFMYGIHKSMIWLLSGVGNKINQYTYTSGNQLSPANGSITSHGTQAYKGSLSFEYFPFEKSYARPKAQILELFAHLGAVEPYWLESNWGENYFPALPDVGLDHSIIENVPNVPSTPYKPNH
jgi:hypothetical protein